MAQIFNGKIFLGQISVDRLASNIPVWPSDHLSGGLRCFGWTSKGAIIQVKKGINIRVVNFSPNNI